MMVALKLLQVTEAHRWAGMQLCAGTYSRSAPCWLTVWWLSMTSSNTVWMIGWQLHRMFYKTPVRNISPSPTLSSCSCLSSNCFMQHWVKKKHPVVICNSIKLWCFLHFDYVCWMYKHEHELVMLYRIYWIFTSWSPKRIREKMWLVLLFLLAQTINAIEWDCHSQKGIGMAIEVKFWMDFCSIFGIPCEGSQFSLPQFIF